MHRSRLSTLLIDVPSDQVPGAAAFWSAALGVPASPVPGEEQFISLPGAFPGLVTAIQAVDDAPRYHLDIETDNVAAESADWSPWGPSNSASGPAAGSSGCPVATWCALSPCTATLANSSALGTPGTSTAGAAGAGQWLLLLVRQRRPGRKGMAGAVARRSGTLTPYPNISVQPIP